MYTENVSKEQKGNDANRVLECVFVINFDDAIIFKVDKYFEFKFYDKKYQTFESAKEDLVSYWDNVLADAKRNLSNVKNLKAKDAKSF